MWIISLPILQNKLDAKMQKLKTLIHICLITYIQIGEQNNFSLFKKHILSEFPLEFLSRFLTRAWKTVIAERITSELSEGLMSARTYYVKALQCKSILFLNMHLMSCVYFNTKTIFLYFLPWLFHLKTCPWSTQDTVWAEKYSVQTFHKRASSQTH